MKTFKTVDAYIASYPEDVQVLLKQLRKAIIKAAPQAEETISYGMPAYKFHGVLVYFGGFKNHVSFFPTGSGVAAFARELKPYNCSKGTVQFPLDKPIPVKLVENIVKHRVMTNLKNQ